MAYRDVILEEDGSLSLNDNTQFIQEYNLDYSDEDRYDNLSSDDEKEIDLSEKHLRELYEKNKKARGGDDNNIEYNDSLVRKKKYQNSAAPKVKKPIKYSGMKYDHDISPSTKEETELHLALLKEKSAKIANKSKESPNVQESDKSKKKRQGNHYNEYSFNINSFLNSSFAPLTNRKGKAVFEYRKVNNNKLPQGTNTRQQVGQCDLTLQTISERYYLKRHYYSAYYSTNSDSSNWRFQYARLNFIDSFMPEHLKIKSKPLALFKYIHARKKYS